MTVNLTGGIDYTQWQPVSETVSNTNTVNTNSATTTPQTNSLERTEAEDTFVSNSTEACTDGKDDGKIGFFSAAGNFVKGAVNGLANGIKGMFCDKEGNFSLGNTLKSAAIIGSCFIPGVGPFIAAGLCVVGVAKGTTGIIKSISAASNAQTDAEAKEAFQSLGSNSLTTGLSIAGLKGATNVIAKSSGFESVLGKTNSVRSSIVNTGIRSTAKQLSTSITNPYSGAVSTGLSKASGTGIKGNISRAYNVSKEVVKTGAEGTANNIIGAAKTIKEQTSNTYNKLTGKTGTGSLEKVAKKLSTKNNKLTASDIETAINKGEITVGNKTYNISQVGDDITYSLKNTTTNIYTKENTSTLQEKVSLENLDKTGFSQTDISKIENLKTNQSYTTKNGIKITKTDAGYSSTRLATGSKTTIYENVQADKLSKIVGKDLAADINTQLTSNTYLGVGDDVVYIQGKNGIQYYYEPKTNTLTTCSDISTLKADVNNFIDGATNTSGYTYTPIISELAQKI